MAAFFLSGHVKVKAEVNNDGERVHFWGESSIRSNKKFEEKGKQTADRHLYSEMLIS